MRNFVHVCMCVYIYVDRTGNTLNGLLGSEKIMRNFARGGYWLAWTAISTSIFSTVKS